MSENVFAYPGSKTMLADWIEGHFCSHHTYVEPFGGSASVLANKPPSDVEVLNDRDGDIVHFFETLRDNGDELVEWLRETPHSRELHDKYAKAYYNGYRPGGDVERAGRFWYLRETQFAQKYDSFSGYNGAKARNVAKKMRNKRERLKEFSTRFNHVQIECMDYSAVFDRYDSEETLFYCDPPYIQEGDDLYTGPEFDHFRFVKELADLDGFWVVSYTDLPPGLEELSEVIATKDRKYRMRQGQHGWEKENTEKLVMNYDIEKMEEHTDKNQTTLGEL